MWFGSVGNNNSNIICNDDLNDDNGRLLGDSDGVAYKSAEGTAHGNIIMKPTLEQSIAIINNPDLNREGMIKAIKEVYKQ